MYRKNITGQKLVVYAFDSTTNAPKTGDAANLTAYISQDDGSLTALGDTSATEISSTNAKGYYSFDLTQAETNAVKLFFSAKSSTANVVVRSEPATFWTAPVFFERLPISSGGLVTVDAGSIELQPASTYINNAICAEYGDVASSTSTTVTFTPNKGTTTPASLVGCTVTIANDGGEGSLNQPRLVIGAVDDSGNIALTVERAWDFNPTSSNPARVYCWNWSKPATTAVGFPPTDSLTADALASDAVTEIAAAVWAYTCETGVTMLQALRGIAAVLLGKVTGAGGASETFKAAGNDGTDRVVTNGDEDGNRDPDLTL